MVRTQFSDRTLTPQRHAGEARLSHRGHSWRHQKTGELYYIRLAVWNRHSCRGAAGGAPSHSIWNWFAVNHSFRPDSPRFSATDKHASPNIGSITKAQPTTFWDTIYFYTASATVGNQSSIVPRETSHHERDGLMTTCGCLFGIVCLNKTRALERCRREKKRAFNTRVEIFANGGSID